MPTRSPHGYLTRPLLKVTQAALWPKSCSSQGIHRQCPVPVRPCCHCRGRGSAPVSPPGRRAPPALAFSSVQPCTRLCEGDPHTLGSCSRKLHSGKHRHFISVTVLQSGETKWPRPMKVIPLRSTQAPAAATGQRAGKLMSYSPCQPCWRPAEPTSMTNAKLCCSFSA